MGRVVVKHEHVVGADYSGLTLDKFSAEGSTFEGCVFDRSKVADAGFGSGMEQSQYINCSFDRASLTSLGGYTRFINCTFRNARFAGCIANYLEFVGCTFTGRITALTMYGAFPSAENRYRSVVASLARQGRSEPPGYRRLALRERNEIRDNDFTAAELIDVNFRFGVDLTAQRLPAGDDYLYLPDAETTLLRGLATLEHDSSPTAESAVRYLRILLDKEIGTGQRQLLLRAKDYERKKVIPPHIQLAVDVLRTKAATGPY
ncbi:pentapeptide repeat-containing protein [Actinoplanes regularis]|uniref:Pentapeptide repeat-containing protein n=1 Tax=Actinoplanes regularis TaxID=52697 RepID=A0A239ITS2_9ACTN|nr:pentapeptide repeat-containing protein [Actinoplanes regularis]SNS97176.1 Pentapeptide repeat-containing protein [Actinoplanes regularis]